MSSNLKFVIGIGSTQNHLTILHPDLSTETLDAPYDLDNPPELGQSLVYDENGLACAGPDCLHYTNFQDHRPEVMDTPEWTSLLQNTLLWRGWGSLTEAVVPGDFPNTVYLKDLNMAALRPPSMNPAFTGQVFAFKVGNLDLQVEPVVEFGWVETLHRKEDSPTEIVIGIVHQSKEGWSQGQEHLATRTYLVISELELLHLWRTKFLNPGFLGKAIDPSTGNLLPQYPDHPVPEPEYSVQAKMNHPHAANYIIDSETNTIMLLTDVVARNGNNGDYEHETQDNG